MSGKIAFRAIHVIPEDELAAHRRYARGLGLHEIGQSGPLRIPLAVVGGGHSAAEHIDELRGWEGEIWAINKTWQWCRNNGIEATFYSIDSLPIIAEWTEGATRAMLADSVHPSVFDVCKGVTLARTGLDAILHDTTSAASAPMIAAEAGYSSVTFFGCDGSFGNTTHVNKDVPGARLVVRCGGKEFTTAPDMLMQTEFLAEMARALPEWISVRGNGFLSALIAHGDYDVTHVTRDLHDAWTEAQNGEPC
jgi:hypothetical protein